MANVINVAKCVLEQLDYATTMKLQKIVYYSQVGYLVRYKTVLFDESIQAWANGPVVPALFHAHAGMFIVAPSDIKGNSSELSAQERSMIINVAKLYKDYSGEQLRELTHSEDPWINARKGIKPGERCNNVITVDALQEYYGRLNGSSANPIVSLYN